MLDEQMLRRLAFVRYIHGLAVDQSRQPEPQCAMALLTFQDSIELFFQLACEQLDVKTDRNTRFDEYWALLDAKLGDAKLTQGPAVSRLNKARVALKHYGTLPAVLDLESYRTTTVAFFAENTPRAFGIEFDSISLVDMVQCETARALLREAQGALGNDECEKALEKTALAFSALLADYELRAQEGPGSPFDFDPFSRMHRPPSVNDRSTAELVRHVYGVFDDMSRQLLRVSEALRILALGIDYRRYLRFQRLTPTPRIAFDGHVSRGWAWEELPSPQECGRCIDFVIDCAIRLQQLDLDTSQSEGLGKKRRSLDPPQNPAPVIRMTRGGLPEVRHSPPAEERS